MTAGYLDHIKDRDETLVDVKVPSGYVFQFAKPKTYSLIFQLGNLPSTATSEAVEQWDADGAVPDLAEEMPKDADEVAVGRKVLEVRDQILKLSRKPKLVVGKAKDATELSTSDLDDDDAEFLFKWVAAGGNAGAMLAMFPERPQASPLASASRKKRSRKGK